MTRECATRYPLVLVHGAAFRDDNKLFNYWGRIPKALEAAGATVYYSRQDAWGTIAGNALVFRENLKSILAETGAAKVNLIAHSKGGLESRYLISSLGMADSVASLTTVSTPHHGSVILDWLCRLPQFLYRAVAFFVDLGSRWLGDTNPDFFTASRQLSRQACLEFNAINPDQPGIIYRSYAGRMRNPFSALLFFWSNLIINLIEGPNDGLVTVESAKWGDFRGEIRGRRLGGVSHADTIDLFRITTKSFDIIAVYKTMVAELQALGL